MFHLPVEQISDQSFFLFSLFYLPFAPTGPILTWSFAVPGDSTFGLEENGTGLKLGSDREKGKREKERTSNSQATANAGSAVTHGAKPRLLSTSSINFVLLQ